MSKYDERDLYDRCKSCGQILTDLEIDDNDGYCDFCFIQCKGYSKYIGYD